MPRFVILEHDHPVLHWDLMLEVGSVLETWRLAKAPEKKGENIEAFPLPEHRVCYLDYEGPVSGNRGNVRRWDSGVCEFLPGVEGQVVKFRLLGKKVQGTGILQKAQSQWSFLFETDR